MNGDISFKAKWRLVLKDKDGNIKETREGFNEMSKAAKIRAGILGSQYLNDFTLNYMGRGIISDYDGTGTDGKSKNNNYQRRLTLLNLGNRQKTDHLLPVYNSDGVDDATIAYVNAAPDGKTYSYVGDNKNILGKQTLMNKLIGTEITGFFGSDKANGTPIDTVAIMSGIGTPTSNGYVRYNGFFCWQSISKAVSSSSNTSYTWILPPSVNGLTNENEILVCCIVGGVKVYKINFNTGEITDTEYNASLWGMNGDGTYNSLAIKSFYRISNSLVAYDFGGTQKIVQYASDGTPTVVKSDTLGSSTYSNDAISGWYMLPNDDNYIYFNTNNTSSRNFYKYAINNSFTRSSATDPIANLPSLWNESTAYYKPIVMTNNQDRTKYWIYSRYRGEGIECTDLSNVKSTIIGTCKYHPFMSSFKILNEDWLFKGTFGENGNNYNVEYPLRATSSAIDPANLSTFTGFNSAYFLYAGFICPDAYSNWYNCFTVNPPITKTSEDTLEVSCWVYPVIT